MGGFLTRMLGKVGSSWFGEALLWLVLIYLARIIGGGGK